MEDHTPDWTDVDQKTHYRAQFTLERVEPYTDDRGMDRDRTAELAAVTVTGDTPADAMVQLCAHADSLCDWHQDQADDGPASTLDEAFKALNDLYDNLMAPLKYPPRGGLLLPMTSNPAGRYPPRGGLLLPMTSNPAGRHRCSVCGKPGPILHEGDRYTCPGCNAVLDAQKAEAGGAAEANQDGAGKPCTDPWCDDKTDHETHADDRASQAAPAVADEADDALTDPEHCGRPHINVPPRTDEPLVDGLTQAERDLLADRERLDRLHGAA